MKALPNMVFNEPTATGWLRTELYGNRALAASYAHAARTLLGALRSQYGVNQRIAEGEPGGFYHGMQLLPDGSQIQVITNDGLDTLRIWSPTPSSSSSGEGEESERSTPAPYLWIGVRAKYSAGTMPWYALQTMLIEPEGAPTRGFIQNGSGSRGWYTNLNAEFDPAENVTLLDPTDSLAFQMQRLHDQYSGDQAAKRLEDHCLALVDFSNNYGFFYFSMNGVRLYDVNTVIQADTTGRWMPYDPLLPADGQDGGRDFSGRGGFSVYDQPLPELAWDCVYVLDPFDEDGVAPCDSRPQIVAARRFLESQGMAAGEAQILPGAYALAINAFGSYQETSTRAGQAVPGMSGLTRRPHYDYREYLVGSRFAPLTVEIEVRLGKDPDMQTFNFELTCADYDDRNANMLPFGFGAAFDPCTREGGANPHGPNWAQQTLLIDVQNATAELTEMVPTPIGGGTYSASDVNYRDPVDIYLYGNYGVSQIASADYPHAAGAGLFTVLEQMTAAVWGGPHEINEHSAAAIQAAAAGLTKGFVWRYDPVANSFTALPLISTVDDYNYNNWTDVNGATHASEYQPQFFWYYPYKQQSKAQCRASFGMLFGADQSYAFESGQNVYHNDPPYPSNCC